MDQMSGASQEELMELLRELTVKVTAMERRLLMSAEQGHYRSLLRLAREERPAQEAQSAAKQEVGHSAGSEVSTLIALLKARVKENPRE